MSDNRTSVSQANTYREIGELWDTHDAAALGNKLSQWSSR